MIWNLLDALRLGLEAHLRESAPGLVVRIGDFPPVPDDPATAEPFPFILLSVPSGKSAEQQGVRVHLPLAQIICGIWTPDGRELPEQPGQPHTEAESLQLQYRVLQWLMSNSLLDRRYERLLPLRWGRGTGREGRTQHEVCAAHESDTELARHSPRWITAKFQFRGETEDIGPVFDRVYGTTLNPTQE